MNPLDNRTTNIASSRIEGRQRSIAEAQPVKTAPEASQEGLVKLTLQSDTKAKDAAPVDEQRVAALKDAIASGKYRIDPQRIAAALVELDFTWKNDQ